MVKRLFEVHEVLKYYQLTILTLSQNKIAFKVDF